MDDPNDLPLPELERRLGAAPEPEDFIEDEDADAILDMLDEVGHATDQLNDWERNFITSISDQYQNKGSLSPKQRAKLEAIYHKLK